MLGPGGVHVHAKPRQNGGIDAADGGNRQKPVIGDVDHHQADLIHMGGQHKGRRLPPAYQASMDRAHDVGGDLVGHALHALAHHGGDALLAARRRRGLEQALEIFAILFVHLLPLSKKVGD